MFQILTEGYGQSWKAFSRRVKMMDKELEKGFKKELRKIAKPIVEEVREAARDLPSKSGVKADKWRKKKGITAGAGLRQGIAAAVESKVAKTKFGTVSYRIRVSGTKFTAATGKPGSLPRYVEGLSKRPWRHPVYGDTENWVVQSSTPYLLKTVIPHRPDVEEAVRKALKDAANAVGFH